MHVLKTILRDQTFIAHGLGMLGVVGSAVAGASPLFAGIIAALTGIFHVAQTFGNGTAIPPGWTAPGAASSPALSPASSAAKPDRAASTSTDGAGFGAPHVDAPAPSLPLMNAAGTAEVER